MVTERRLFLGALGSLLGGCALDTGSEEEVGLREQATTTWPDGTYATLNSAGRVYATHDYTDLSYLHIIAAAAGTPWHAANPQRFAVMLKAMNEVTGGLCGNAARARYNAKNNWCTEFAAWTLLASGIGDAIYDPVGAGGTVFWHRLSEVRVTAQMISLFNFYHAFTVDSSMVKTSVRPGDYLPINGGSGRNSHSALALAVSVDYRWVWTAEGNVGDCVSWNRRPYFTDGVLNPDINGVGNIGALY